MSCVFVVMIGEVGVRKRLFGLSMKRLGFMFCFSALRVLSFRFEKMNNNK